MQQLSTLRQLAAIAICVATLAAGSAMAEPLNIQATMVPKEQLTSSPPRTTGIPTVLRMRDLVHSRFGGFLLH